MIQPVRMTDAEIWFHFALNTSGFVEKKMNFRKCPSCNLLMI